MSRRRFLAACLMAWTFSFFVIYSLYGEASRFWLAYLGAALCGPLWAPIGAAYVERGGARWRRTKTSGSR